MEFGLAPPPFFESILALLGLYVFSYCLGFFAFRLCGFFPKGEIHNEFSRLLTGFLLILLFFSIYKTKGSTVFTGLLVPFLFLALNKFFRGNEKSSFLPSLKILLIHIFFFFSIFFIQYFSNYNPFSGNILEAHIDKLAYGRYCEHIGITGEENLFLDWYLPLNQGNSFYHYIDLWGGVLGHAISGIGYYYGLALVSYSFSIILACWAAFSFLESFKYRISLLTAVLSLSVIFLSQLAEVIQPVFEAIVNPSRIYSETLSENPKLAFVSIFLLFSLRQFKLRDFKGGFLALTFLMIVYGAVIPTVFSSMVIYCIYLLILEKQSLKMVLLWMLPVLASLLYLFLFYRFSSGYGYDVRAVDSGHFIEYYSSLGKIIIGIKLTIVTALSGIASWLVFLPLIWILGTPNWSRLISVFSDPAKVFLMIIVLTGCLCFGIFHPLMDSPQFWSISASIGTSVALLLLLAKIFHAKGFYPLKIYSVLVIGFLVWQNHPPADEVNGENKAFLNNIMKMNHSDTFKFSVFNQPKAEGLLWKDQNNYFPLLVLSSQFKVFRPVCLTMRESVREKNPFYDKPLQNMIRISEINRYVEAQIKEGAFISESESKLSFMREYEIPFAMIAPDYDPDSILGPHFNVKCISPFGWKFCEFIDRPSNTLN